MGTGDLSLPVALSAEGTGTQKIGKPTSPWVPLNSHRALESICCPLAARVFKNDCQNTEVFMLTKAEEFLSS